MVHRNQVLNFLNNEMILKPFKLCNVQLIEVFKYICYNLFYKIEFCKGVYCIKKLIATILLCVCLISAVGCGSHSVKPINTIEGNMKTYYEMSDGTWKFDKYIYKYRLKISGRMPNAVKDTTYVILSNIEDISFQKAMLASGLSSNTEDYFDIKDAVFVEIN